MENVNKDDLVQFKYFVGADAFFLKQSEFFSNLNQYILQIQGINIFSLSSAKLAQRVVKVK